MLWTFEAVREREARGRRLGVFWHAQGAGKSYSMVMFARKVHRKLIQDGMDLPESTRRQPKYRNMQRMALDDAFKAEGHPFCIAVVCAMWRPGATCRASPRSISASCSRLTP